MSIGLIGTKIGMTREFMESGQSVPVTVIKVEKGRVLDVISKEKKGYSAVKVGFFKLKNSKLTKQMKGYFAKKNTEPKKILKEFRVDDNEQYKEGNELGLEVHAGHGLTFSSAKILSKIHGIIEFNIGHFLIGESIFVGLPKTINLFKKILKK